MSFTMNNSTDLSPIASAAYQSTTSRLKPTWYDNNTYYQTCIENEHDAVCYANASTANIIVKMTTMLIMWTFSLVANVLVCLVIQRSRRLQSTTNYFVVSLACGDLCLTLFCIPLILSGLLAGKWIAGLAMCKIIRYIQLVIPCSTIAILLSVCADRFYTIIYPLSFKITRTVAKKLIAASWSLAFIVCSPCLYFYETTHIGNGKELCNLFLRDTWYSTFFVITVITVIYVIPVTIIITVYVRIFRYIWCTGSSGRRLQRTANQVPRAKVKMLRLIILVNVCVLLLMAPYFTAFLWYARKPKYQRGYTVYSVVFWIYFATTVVKPLIYLTLNSNFRRGCKEMLCMSTMKCYRHNVYTITALTKVGRTNHIGIAESEGGTKNNYNKLESPSKTFNRANATEKHAWPLINSTGSSNL